MHIHLDPEKTYLLVGHKKPDTDTIGAMTLFAEALGKPLSEFLLAFVPPGERYTDPTPPGVDQIVHFDTGGKFDPEDFFFNEHAQDCKYPSSTRIVYEYCLDHTQNIPKYLTDFVDYVDYVDSPNTRERSHEKDKTIALLSEMAADELGKDELMIALKRRGPIELARMVNNLRSDISDKEKAITVWLYIDSWFNSFRTRTKINTLLSRSMILKNVNDLTFGLIGVNNFSTKELRSCVNAQWRNRIKLYITQHKDNETGEYGSFNVTIVGDVRTVTPLQVLAERLYDRFPDLDREKNDIFIHDSGFCMYIQPRKGLTLAHLNSMALKTLKRQAPDTTRNKFYSTSNQAPYDNAERLIRDQAIPRKTPSGITIGYIPPNDFTTKIIRETVSLRFPNKYTVIVTQNPAKKWSEGQVNITVIGNPRDVTGMAHLARKIFNEYDELKHSDMFLHRDEFCLYIRAARSISFDRIIDLTAETLKLATEKRRASQAQKDALAVAS